MLYLPLNDIYLDIKFTQWDSLRGGGYTYLRAVPPSSGPTGDYNGNGFVDAADYTVWRDTFGQTASPQGSGADGNSNGMIDEEDYDFWKLNFGNPVFAAGSASGAAPSCRNPHWLLPLPASPRWCWLQSAFDGHAPRSNRSELTRLFVHSSV